MNHSADNRSGRYLLQLPAELVVVGPARREAPAIGAEEEIVGRRQPLILALAQDRSRRPGAQIVIEAILGEDLDRGGGWRSAAWATAAKALVLSVIAGSDLDRLVERAAVYGEGACRRLSRPAAERRDALRLRRPRAVE